jgi:hypothetical protein
MENLPLFASFAYSDSFTYVIGGCCLGTNPCLLLKSAGAWSGVNMSTEVDGGAQDHGDLEASKLRDSARRAQVARIRSDAADAIRPRGRSSDANPGGVPLAGDNAREESDN